MPAQSQSLSEQLYALLYTTDDVERLSDAIENLQSELYKEDSKSPIDKLDDCIPQTFATVIKASFQNPPQTPQEMKQVITHIKDSLTAISTITLTLAVDPPLNTIEKLSEWVKTTYGNTAVMELTINPAILGGAIIIHEGTYLDISLKKKLDNLFETKKADISALLA